MPKTQPNRTAGLPRNIRVRLTPAQMRAVVFYLTQNGSLYGDHAPHAKVVLSRFNRFLDADRDRTIVSEQPRPESRR